MKNALKKWIYFMMGTALAAAIFLYAARDARETWKITVYYTPVEAYYAGSREDVTGCLVFGCSEPVFLGSFPVLFLEVVRLEGAGKISAGQHAGNYIQWTRETGYWVTETPLAAKGNTLVPWVSAAASRQFAFGENFRIVGCGKELGGGQPLPQHVCDQITSQVWIIDDRFGTEPEFRHVDLYIGEQDRADFLESHPFVFAAEHASIEFIEK